MLPTRTSHAMHTLGLQELLASIYCHLVRVFWELVVESTKFGWANRKMFVMQKFFCIGDRRIPSRAFLTDILNVHRSGGRSGLYCNGYGISTKSPCDVHTERGMLVTLLLVRFVCNSNFSDSWIGANFVQHWRVVLASILRFGSTE